MSFPIYDYRKDIRNILVTPEIRSRFIRMEPGDEANLHSHDLGHEIFLVLEGVAEFEISGETGEVGPGQLCIALADEIHKVRAVGDDPMTLYLSVTPHIQPTHTGRTETGERLPTRFARSSSYDVKSNSTDATRDLLERHLAAARELSEAAQAAVLQEEMLSAMRSSEDLDDLLQLRDAIWKSLYKVHKSAYKMADVWNDLADRVEQLKEDA